MKKLIKLPFINELESNLEASPQFIQVLLGPRQVGKTTTTLHFLEHDYQRPFIYVSADNVIAAGRNWLMEHWQEARFKKATLVIDEIQKVDNWAEVVKALWDEEKRRVDPIRCVLLGSSSLDIQRGLTESLTGRFQLIRAHHWNYSESSSGYGISFEEFLRYGGYPGSYPLISEARLSSWSDYLNSSIISTVIEKDILSNQTVKSPALFKQAFQILCAYPAQEISYTKLLGQLQDKGNTDLIKYYISLYEGAFLMQALEKFSAKPFKRKSSSPKIVPLCPALFQLSILAPLDQEERGRVFEMIVGAQLIRTGHQVYYWREGNHEVDFVLKKGKLILAVEVKSGRKKSGSGMDKFLTSFPGSKGMFITPENYIAFERDPMGLIESVV
jgi:uncharacterized protein